MSDRTPVTVAVVNAGLSDASSTARLGHAVVDVLQEAASRRGTSVDTRVVDLRPLARGIAAINLRTVGSIFMSWIITIPAGALLSVFFFLIIRTLAG